MDDPGASRRSEHKERDPQNQPSGGSISYGTRTIRYQINFAPRKTARLTVLLDPSVSAIAPTETPLTDVEDLLRRHARWIVMRMDESTRSTAGAKGWRRQPDPLT